MRVLRVHFRTGMAGELLSDFLRYSGVCHRRIEAMPQGMKREVGQFSAAACFRSFTLNLRLLHDRSEAAA